MTTSRILARGRFAPRIIKLLALAAPAWLWMSPAPAQQGGQRQHQAHQDSAPVSPAVPGSGDLADELGELRAKIARVEAALEVEHRAAAASSGQQAAPGGKMRSPGMRNMRGAPTGPPKAGSGAAGMGPGKMGKAGMAMMGKPRMGPMGAAAAAMVSALPGIPGASHIYHVGSTGFFLDHPEHITLTTEQRLTLNRLKEKALLEQATAQRKIDELEQQLWVLTGSDQPDAAGIRAKLAEIEKLRADQRFAYIRAVGEAAGVLTGPQRQRLLGLMAVDSPK